MPPTTAQQEPQPLHRPQTPLEPSGSLQHHEGGDHHYQAGGVSLSCMPRDDHHGNGKAHAFFSRTDMGSTALTDATAFTFNNNVSGGGPTKSDKLHQALQRLAPWFGLLSLAYMAPWTTLGSLVSYFKTRHGPEFFVKLNCAYYLPGLPVALLQQYGDEALDARVGTSRAYLGRNGVALAVAAWVLLALPAVSADAEGAVLALIAVLGAVSWLAHGTATTLATMFPPVALTWLQTGFRIPEIYTLAMVAALNVGAHPDPAHLKFFLLLTAALVLAGLVAWVYLVTRPATRALLKLKDQGGVSATTPSHARVSHHQPQPQPQPQPQHREDAPLLPLAQPPPSTSASASASSHLVPLTEAEKAFVEDAIKPSRQVLFVTIASSIFLSSFLAYVRSPNEHRAYCICEALYFVRLFSDLTGRPLATLLPRPHWLASPTSLLHAAVARLLLAAVFFCYIGLPGFPQSDLLVAGLVSAFSLLSGYLVVLAYRDAAEAVSYLPAYQCHAGVSMNLTFQAAAFSAVLLGLVFVDLGCVPPSL